MCISCLEQVPLEFQELFVTFKELNPVYALSELFMTVKEFFQVILALEELFMAQKELLLPLKSFFSLREHFMSYASFS